MPLRGQRETTDAILLFSYVHLYISRGADSSKRLSSRVNVGKHAETVVHLFYFVVS